MSPKLDFWIANLPDGKKIAYVKKYIDKAESTIKNEIKKAETAGEHRLNQPSNVSIRNEIENVKWQIQGDKGTVLLSPKMNN